MQKSRIWVSTRARIALNVLAAKADVDVAEYVDSLLFKKSVVSRVKGARQRAARTFHPGH